MLYQNKNRTRPTDTTAEKRGLVLIRVAVILHERVGNWSRQLRPRLHDRPVRWFETRSRQDLDTLLGGLACPVILIDVGFYPAARLRDLEHVLDITPDARVLVLDSEARDIVVSLARELGATHAVSGFAPPPFVANLLGRWIDLAHRSLESRGWSRTMPPETRNDPWAWLAEFLGDTPFLRQESSSPIASVLTTVPPVDGDTRSQAHDPPSKRNDDHSE